MSTRSRNSKASDDVDMATAEEEFGSRTPPKAGEGTRLDVYVPLCTLRSTTADRNKHSPRAQSSRTTTSCTTITYSHLPMRRPAGKPGTPRSKSLKKKRFTATFDDLVVCTNHTNSMLQRLQRHTRSAKKRGRASTLATTQRKASLATKRSQHRRWYRWCKSNVGYFEEGLDRRPHLLESNASRKTPGTRVHLLTKTILRTESVHLIYPSFFMVLHLTLLPSTPVPF